jgi:hypothetical protein
VASIEREERLHHVRSISPGSVSDAISHRFVRFPSGLAIRVRANDHEPIASIQSRYWRILRSACASCPRADRVESTELQ